MSHQDLIPTLHRRAPSGQGTGPLTKRLRKYDYKIHGNPLNFRVWDTMGWTQSDYGNGELNYILDGQLPDKFDLSRANPSTSQVKVN
jgi:hypothetical protein